MALNDKQRLFVREYLKDFNATQAYLRAGYGCSEAVARRNASRLLANADIQSELGRLAGGLLSRNEVTVERVVNELAHLAFLDPAQFFDDEGNLLPIHLMPAEARRAVAGFDHDEITIGEGKEKKPIGMTTKLRLTRKEKALELLGRYLKMWEDSNKTEVTLRLVDLTGAK